MKRLELGKSSVSVSPLAIGTGTHGWSYVSDQTRKGENWLTDLFEKGYEAGINFWDLADQYGSHPFARKALCSLDRAGIVINTKTTSTVYENCCSDIERFRTELDTEYLDVVLLHGKRAETWNTDERGAMDALSEAKNRGKVRAVGISSHSLKALRTAAAEPWVDIILVRINFAGTDMDADPDTVVQVLRTAKANGKGIYAMKVMGCGSLSAQAGTAIKYVAELDCVDAMTLGFMSIEEMTQSIEIYRQVESGKISTTP